MSPRVELKINRLSTIRQDQHNSVPQGVVVVLVLLFAVFPLLTGKWVIGLGLVTLSFTILSLLKDWRIAAPLGVFCCVCIVSVIAKVPFSQVWLGLGLLIYIIFCKKSNRFKTGLDWLQFGRLDRKVYLPTLFFVLLASSALIVWFLVAKPNIKDLIDQMLPDCNPALLTAGALLFSMVNAAVEEGAYRGVIMHSLDAALGAKWTSTGLQAAAFGALHLNGFPRGWLGVLLAAVFGIFMGIVRRRADGMLAPWIAHVLVDVVIVCIVAGAALTT